MLHDDEIRDAFEKWKRMHPSTESLDRFPVTDSIDAGKYRNSFVESQWLAFIAGVRWIERP